MSNNNFRFLNEKCLVCNNSFKEDDDIVVCPHCGTPHHRECYKESTRCANHENHGEDFHWEPTFVTPEDVNTPEEEIKPPFGQVTNLDQIPMGIPFPPLQQNLLNSFPQELEEGVKTEDVTIFVRHEFPKYLKKFQKIKDGKFTWNWAAFFFAPYWFFYRKMHKLGVVFLAIFILLSSMSFLPPAVKLSEAIYDFETQVQELTEKVETDAEYETAIMDLYKSTYEKLNENKTGLTIYMVQSVANFVISVFIGLNANKWYYKHTLSQVKKISVENETEKRREKLFITGGVAYGATFLAILAEKTVFFALEMLITTFM
jgi:hypothetical protein